MPTHAGRADVALATLSTNDLIGQLTRGLKPQVPWKSIQEFVTSPKYLGYKPFPKQLTLLKLIFLETENMTQFDIDTIEKWRKGFGGKESYGVQPDVWHRVKWLKDNGYRRFPHIQNVMGRRGSKGWIGGVLGAEQVAYMVALENWQKHYGVQGGKTCWISSLATNYDQAKKFQFADISEAINTCAYLKPYVNVSNEYTISVYTPNDLRQIAMARAKKRKLPDKDLASIRIIAMPASSAGGRGGVGLGNFYDEFAFMLNGTGGPADSDNVYSAYQPALVQFRKDGLTYIPSSPFTKVGKFYELYEDGIVLMDDYLKENGIEIKVLEDDDKRSAADPKMLVYQGPSWGLYEDWERTEELYGYPKDGPVIANDEYMEIEKRKNPTKFKVEYLGQFAEVADAYLDPDKVDNMFKPFWGERILNPAPYGILDYQYHAHIDPSSVNANFALCIGHLEPAPEPDEHGLYWPHVIIDYLKVWKPKDFPDHTIDYVQITKEITETVFNKYPSLVEFTADQYNSPGLFSSFKLLQHPASIHEETFTKTGNMSRTEKFKSAINLGWVHSYRDNFYGTENDKSLLEMELKFLSEKNGQVVKQETGPVTTKDLADCVMSVSVRLLTQQLDQYQARIMEKLQPNFSDVGTMRVVDNISTATRASQARENMADIAERGMRGNYAGPRWSRR